MFGNSNDAKNWIWTDRVVGMAARTRTRFPKKNRDTSCFVTFKKHLSKCKKKVR
jgi:hypothetical protein